MGRKMTAKRHRELSGKMEMFYILIGVVVILMYIFIKIDLTHILKMCKLYCM